jgi:hypothetical protein
MQLKNIFDYKILCHHALGINGLIALAINTNNSCAVLIGLVASDGLPIAKWTAILSYRI